jgi:hypothetical protein
MKSCIPFDKVLLVLKKNEAPQELLERYVELIDDLEVKFDLAKELKLTSIAIDVSAIIIFQNYLNNFFFISFKTLIKTRDRQKLEEFGSKLDRQSKEYSYIQNALRATNIKWKN